LNLLTPRKCFFLFTLNVGAKKISLHPCFCLILISCIEWADPKIKKFFFLEKILNIISLLNDGR